ncbi:hypothetical protein [Corallococcus sp. AS-1-6]|uniref:hypothetical protein n=1 Tax=Corallococcus sp. AS-1-6 TaxID=2874599 RepID=UPI001CC0B418|nr:hypothetical protein [Corallococcus sp. AS-1-6]MBZ4373786.1 hypothetical protein [Corallococcus sp. AS-1-6]
MPMSLLLHEVLGPLVEDSGRTLSFSTLALDRARRGLTRLDPFNRLVALEETLIARARSAFLVHWFGTGLPTSGLALRVSIANIDSLRRRYQAVLSATRPDDRGLNLTEPLLGLVGNLAGSLLSPAGVVSLTVLARRLIPTWVRVLLFIFGWSIIPGIAAAVGVLLAPGGLGLGVLLGARNEQPVRAIHDLMGALARLIEQVNRFIDLLLGPRERIRNPLLRQFLEVFDSFARLIPFALALVSLVIARVGPLILPLARQAAALIPLTGAVMTAVRSIFEEIPQVLENAFSRSRAAPLGHLMAILQGIGPLLHEVTDRIKTLLEEVAATLPGIGMQVMGAVRTFWETARSVVTRRLRAHPVISMMETLKTQFAEIGTLFASPSTGTPPASSGTSVPGWITSGITSLFGPPPPTPTAPALPDLTALQALIGRPSLSLDMAGFTSASERVSPSLIDMFRLSDRARADFDRAATPSSEFARARRALARDLGAPVTEVLARIRTEELPLRQALSSVIGRVLPPAIRAYLPDLLDLFHTLDAELYRQPSAPTPTAFPTLDVPESRRLHVVVRRIEIRSAGSDEPHVGVFRDRLVEALQRQQYQAPVTP